MTTTELKSVRQNTDALSGETPAIHAIPVPAEGTYGCAIVMRTCWYHPHLRWWTGAAARRRGAAVSSTGQDKSEIELRSKPFSGCLSIYMLPGTYLDDAEER